MFLQKDLFLTDIKDFVYAKNKDYSSLKNIICFQIINVPSRLDECEMTDYKLEFEEYAIRYILHSQNVPFGLVDHNNTGFGLWQEGQALIPLKEI